MPATMQATLPGGRAGTSSPVAVDVLQGGHADDFRARPPAGIAHGEWRRHLKRSLGSCSDPFIDASLHRLLAACNLPGQGTPTSTGISAALALIDSLEPLNEIQATLAVHIACLDAASSNMLSRLAWGGSAMRTKVTSNAVGKLERAFHSAINTFYRVKRGNTQTIRIERLEIQSGAQAVVGQVVSGNR